MTTHLRATPLPPVETGLRVVTVAAPESDRNPALNSGVFDSPVGPVVALGAEGVLWALGIAGEMSPEAVLADFAHRWPRARLVPSPEALAPAIGHLLRGRGEIRIRLAGTPFQCRVWRALLDIGHGRMIGYGQLAERIGQPGAARAVGAAVGRNPVSWVVPCHRVTRASGEPGGYHWGVSVKRALLRLEGVAEL